MPADDRSSTYRSWLRRIELACSLVLLTAMATIALSDSEIRNELALSIGFFVPGVLGLSALISSGLDVYAILRREPGRTKGESRWLLTGRVVLASTIGLLAAATLFLVIQTILIVTVIDTGGGVVFGPILWMFTGSVLAVAVLLRFAGETIPHRR